MTAPRRWDCRERPQAGATVVEMAIVATVLFALIMGMIAFSLIEVGNSVGSNAAREGARYGIINVDCADSYVGSGVAGHDGCASPSPNYTGIVSAVTAKLAGLVQGTPVVAVRCINGIGSLLSAKACTVTGSGGVNTPVQPDVDLIEVTVTWTHLGTSPFVQTTTHSDIGRMVISGAPR